jgi:hypothetical protein
MWSTVPHLKHCLLGGFRYVDTNALDWKPTFRPGGSVWAWAWAFPACPGVAGLRDEDPAQAVPTMRVPPRSVRNSSDEVGIRTILGAYRGAAVAGNNGGIIVRMGCGFILSVPIRRAIW